MTVLGKGPNSSLMGRRELRCIRYRAHEGCGERIDLSIDLRYLLFVTGDQLQTRPVRTDIEMSEDNMAHVGLRRQEEKTAYSTLKRWKRVRGLSESLQAEDKSVFRDRSTRRRACSGTGRAGDRGKAVWS